MRFCSDRQLKCIALAAPEIVAIEVLVGVVNPDLGKWRSYHADLGPVAPISVNFNHQLAYFADHSDTTNVRLQPTAVA